MKKNKTIFNLVPLLFLLALSSCTTEPPIDPDPDPSFSGVYVGTSIQNSSVNSSKSDTVRNSSVLVTPESHAGKTFIISFADTATRKIVDTISEVTLSGREPNYYYSLENSSSYVQVSYTIESGSLVVLYQDNKSHRDLQFTGTKTK